MAGKKKILIAEDERAIAEFVEALLSLNGYETAIAGNGREAVEKARSFFPDMVLMDIMMPKLSGLDATKILRDDPAFKNTVIMMLTSLTQMGDAEKAFEAGANDYLGKPFEAERLLQKVKKHLGE
ncbi:MAG TPA: response regulator [Elusimicrobiota bacterium]|nr:response regulator [Elusimicrobiota bacterium]